MLYVIGGAIAQIGNYDQVGKFSASNIVDGTVKTRLPDPRAIMEFESTELARWLFDGKENAMNCIGKKKIAVSGMISMLDNVNRILDRVSIYLA